MGVEGQTRDFRDLATEAKENQQMDENLKKIITEVQELSDDKTDNDEMNGVLGDNFDASLNATEEQIKTITRELGKLEKKYKDNATVLQEIKDLTALLEGKIDGDKQRESFDNFSGMIPEKINRLKEDLSRQDKRNIENFIKGDGNKNAVLETYLKMIGVTNMPESTTKRDQHIFDEIKTQIEGKYNQEVRGQRELDTKVFTDTQQFFKDYIQNNSEWDGNTEPTADYIQDKCSGIHMYTADQFKLKFIAKNAERINTNNEEFGKITMEGRYSKEKIKKVKGDNDTFTLEITKDDGTTMEATVENFMDQDHLNIQIEAPEGTAFTSNELQAAIDGNKQSWFDAIVAHVEEKPEPEEPETPALSEFTESDFDSNLKLFNRVTKENIVTAISAAKEHLDAEGVSEEDKATFTERINEVIAALKDGGDRTHGTGSERILELQNTMNAALDGLKSRPLILDGKLGRNTFFAIKEFLGIATRGDRVKYDVPRRRVSDGMAEDYEGFDDLSDENKDSVEAQLRNPRERFKYLLENNKFPGKDIISKITHNGDDLKAVQLQLVPYYNPKGKIQIDGKLGARTLSALENYIKENRDKDGNNIIIPKETKGFKDRSGDLKCVLSNGKAYFDDFNEGNGLSYHQTSKGIEATIKENEKETKYLYQNAEPHLCHEVSGDFIGAENNEVEKYLKMISEARDIGNEQKTDEQKTDEQKTDEQKTDEQKTDEQKTDEQKTDEQKTDEQKTDEQKTDEQKTDEQKTDEQKADEQKTDEQKTDEQKTE